MSYRVIWSRQAETKLTRLWVSSRQRHAMTDASNRIDELLASRPHEVGESRAHGQRVAFIYPLGVSFFIDDQTKIVHVANVWTT
jgi:hypothetical protein